MKQKLSVFGKTSLMFFMTLFSIWSWGQTITINLTSAGGSTNLGSNNYNSGAERTWTQDNVSFGGKAITAATAPNAGAIQAQASNGVIYNTIALPGKIKTIQVNQNASTAFTLYGGTTRLVNSATANYTVTGGTSAGSVTGTTWTSADLSANNYTFFALKKGTNAAYITSIVITYEVASAPSLSATGTFSPFSYVEGNGPSASQSIQASGSNLDGTDVTVAAPTNYEVSLTNGNDFADTKIIPYSGGAFTGQNVYLRLKSGLAVNSYSGNLTISGGGASSNASVAASGNVTAAPPANDLCSASTVLNAGQTTNGTMVNATATSGLSYAATKRDVWYKFTPANTGDHIITANFASGPDLDLDIFTSTCPTSGTAQFTAHTSGVTSEVLTASLTANTDYYIRVIDFNNDASAFDITVQAPQPCTSPNVASNLALTPTSNSISGNFTDASASGYMVVVSQNATLSASPVNGITYNVGDSFGGGSVVKYSSGTTFTANTLNQNTNYYVYVFSYNNQCLGAPYYSATSVSGSATTLAAPCMSENFSSNTQPSGWVNSGTGITYTSGYADMSVNNGSITTSSLAYPAQLTFDLARTTNTTAKTLYIEVSTTSQSTGFVIVKTYDHSNTTSGGSTACTVDLSAYSSNPTVYIRFRKESGTTSPWRIDNVQTFCSAVWNGSTWTTTPNANTDAIITGNYSTTTNPSFTAKNVIIKNGGVLEVTSGNTVNAVDITVEHGGNFIQRDGSTVNYTGTFKTLKNGLSDINKYAFWSSAVANQDLTAIYGVGNTPAFITQYNTATDYFVNATSTISSVGTGYSIKTPVANASLTFTGVPNNGTYTKTLSTAGNGFNLIGNPYPSNLDLNTFYNANSTRISNTFYFWDNTSNSVTTQGGATTVNIGYATYNPATQVWVSAPNISNIPTDNVAAIGQGFIVKATNAADTSLTFTNNMRVGISGVFFNKTTTTDEGKFWLRLSSSYNTSNTFAVAYLAQASDAYDKYDSQSMATGSDAFYTLADAQKLVIQGKGGFDINDIVPVGTKHFEAGNFVISLVKKEGIFDNGQPIYIHDKVLGTYTNLQNGNYTFSANAGELTTRFEIVYKDMNVLAANEIKNEAFEVYKDGEDFVVRNNKNIDSIELFDASGRKISEAVGHTKEIRFKLITKGLYILKAVSAGKEYTKKLIK